MRKRVHHPSSAYSKVFLVSRPGSRGLQAGKTAIQGHLVPAFKKIPHFGAHKYLIWQILVRCGGADLAVRDRRSTAIVPQWCRLAAGRSKDRAVKLHMENKVRLGERNCQNSRDG